jgi:lactate racemase
MSTLRYGNNSSVQLACADGAAPDEVGVPRALPLADLAAATRDAVDGPIDFPPLAQCTTPGDRVVLALDRGVPEAACVTAAVVEALVEAGIDADGITVLASGVDRAGGDPRQQIAAALRPRIALTVHDPTARRELAYLAADKSGEAILINRALHEADVVVSVGCLHGEAAAGYFGIHGAIYPAFSDVKTLQRFRGIGTLNGHGRRHRRDMLADVEYVAWLLGVHFTVQLVPAAGEGVLHVLAGRSESVQRRGQELYRAAWDWPIQRQTDLVVAAIEGGPGQQTWENLGRALDTAGRFADEDGEIAICCDLAAAPGPAVRHLASTGSREAAVKHIGKERPVDAIPAAQIAYALDHNKVYLLSRLEASVVEDLDMVPIGGPEELMRLVRRHPACVLVSNAHRVTAVAAGDGGRGTEDGG